MKIRSTVGEDKELEAMLVHEGIFIDYFEDIHVYDEKTRLIDDFNMQRGRWVYIQLHAFLTNIRYLPSAFINSQHDQIDKLIQWMLVPRTIMMGIIAIMSMILPFIYFTLAIKWWIAGAVVMFAFSLATPDYLVDKNWDRDYLRAPLITIGALFNIFRAGKDEAGNRIEAFSQIIHQLNIFRIIKSKKK
jgi:cellulose synthase/poly-beta-1,6-N-acetylglucosamine synthase-like glycosyltransferase